MAPGSSVHGSERLLNRELSWLDFNERVLALAADPDTPLLERAKFLAIFEISPLPMVVARIDEHILPQDSSQAFMEMAAAGATLYTLDDWRETHA